MKQFGRIWGVVVVVMTLIGTVPGADSAASGGMRPLNALQDGAGSVGNELAVVALREECDRDAALRWSGSSSSIDGAVHSNGGVRMSGSNNTVTGGVTSGCAVDLPGQSNALGPGATQAEPLRSPVDFQVEDITCDFEPPEGDIDQSGPWWEGGTRQSGRLLDGVYCAEGRLKLATSNVTGRVTFIATGPDATLSLSGSNLDLLPYDGTMLAYSESATDRAIRISGSGITWQGIVYAPNGEVSLSGSGGASTGGLIIGDTVTLSGSGWEIAGLPVPAPADVSGNEGSILVHVYTCPVGKDEDHADINWFEICAPASEPVAFEVSPAGTDDAQTGTSDINGQVIFTQLSPGTYQLTSVDSGWCHAKSDSVNAQSAIDLHAGEQANIWAFYCDDGKG